MAKTDAKTGKKPAKAKENSKATPKPASDRKNGKSLGFDVEAEELPEAIVDAAYHSGGYPYGKRMKRKRYDRLP